MRHRPRLCVDEAFWGIDADGWGAEEARSKDGAVRSIGGNHAVERVAARLTDEYGPQDWRKGQPVLSLQSGEDASPRTAMCTRGAFVGNIQIQTFQGRCRANFEKPRLPALGALHRKHAHLSLLHERAKHIADAVVRLPVQAQIVGGERRPALDVGRALSLPVIRCPHACCSESSWSRGTIRKRADKAGPTPRLNQVFRQA